MKYAGFVYSQSTREDEFSSDNILTILVEAGVFQNVPQDCSEISPVVQVISWGAGGENGRGSQQLSTTW